MVNYRLTTFLALLLAVAMPREAARAVTPGSTYNFCGGSGFTFCASVNLSVTLNPGGGYTVAMVVVNRSVSSGGYAPAQFVSIGLDNVLPPGERLSTPSNFHFKQGTWDGTTFSNGLDICGTNPTCWRMATSTNQSGNVNVDFDGDASLGAVGTLGNRMSLASNCTASEAHWSVSPINTCARGTDIALWRPVQISFDVTNAITSTDLYVKAIANGSTECITGTSGPAIACVMGPNTPPPVTATPEPGSMILMCSGIAALGAWRRRKNSPGDV